MATKNQTWVAFSLLIFLGAALLAACQPSAPESDVPPAGDVPDPGEGQAALAAEPQSTPPPHPPPK